MDFTVLSAIIAVQVVAIGWVGHNGGFAAVGKQFQQPTSQATSLEEWKRTAARDPKPGTFMPSAKMADSDGKRLTLKASGSGKPVGLLFLSDCTECAVDDYLGRWDAMQRQHPQAKLYVVPAVKDVEKIQSLRMKQRLRVRFIVRGDRQLTEACNPFFVPRAYVLDGEGRLVYVQPPFISTGAALARIEKLLEAQESKGQRNG